MPGAALRGYGRAFYKSGSSPAWTRKEGKSPSGGLNAKGRASYKGGKLKEVVVENHSALEWVV